MGREIEVREGERERRKGRGEGEKGFKGLTEDPRFYEKGHECSLCRQPLKQISCFHIWNW